MPGWPGISINVHERTNRLNFFDFQLFGLFFCLKIFNLFLWTFPATYIFRVMFETFLFFIPKKNKFWFGSNPSVCSHNRKEIGSVFSGFFYCFFILSRFFYFFKYLIQFLWTFFKKTSYSQINCEHFLFLQLRKILLGSPGICTDILRGHYRTDIFVIFVITSQLFTCCSHSGDHPLVWAEK